MAAGLAGLAKAIPGCMAPVKAARARAAPGRGAWGSAVQARAVATAGPGWEAPGWVGQGWEEAAPAAGVREVGTPAGAPSHIPVVVMRNTVRVIRRILHVDSS